LKKAVNYLRILFFRIANSELPFWARKELYRYSYWLIEQPFSSTNLKAKSLTSHNKLGKHSTIVCLFYSFPFWSNLLKFIIKLKLWIAFSSILPTLL
jgi:hypothetical protein